MIATARRAPTTISGAQAAAHRRWRGVGSAFRRAGGRTGAVHLITLAMAPARREAKGGAKRCDATTSWREQRGGVEDGCVRRLPNEM